MSQRGRVGEAGEAREDREQLPVPERAIGIGFRDSTGALRCNDDRPRLAWRQRPSRWLARLGTGLIGACGLIAAAQGPRQFPPGSLKQLEDLPAGRLRTQARALPPAGRDRALQWLRSFHFTELDLPALQADVSGGIVYACGFGAAAPAEPDTAAPAGAAAVPVSPFPAHLILHSRPGAANVLYLNFSGETVTGTQWNTELARPTIAAVAFSTDSDPTTYSDVEQVAIRRIWQRLAEDFAPFNLDVTTERPATLGNRTAMALITRKTDAAGAANPYSTAGGVAYVNVFGTSGYASYRPAWIYHDNLGNNEANVAEAAAHEVGHNLGLSHDGRTDGAEYYGGHGGGDTSWGPLMGTGYHRNVSQWSKGEYYLASNTQDDLATIAGKLTYRLDDHGNTPGTATALSVTGGTNLVSTTPEDDPAGVYTANKGVLERGADVDVFSFITGAGPVRLQVAPWVMAAGTRGGNLDVRLELYSEAGALLLAGNPADLTGAVIQTNLSEGRYYLHVRNAGTGDPLSVTPTGYTPYGSLGQYFISGFVTEAVTFVAPPVAELHAGDLTQAGLTTHTFTVTYSDDVAVAVASVGDGDLRVTGPNGHDQPAQFVALDAGTDGTTRTATYAVAAPGGGVWSPAHNGTYVVWMRPGEVADAQGAFVSPGELGEFAVAVPAVLYAANLDANPNWTLEPDWQYGIPAYGNNGPAGGFTGTRILGYNLSGNYPNNLPARYATTPPINTAGSTSLTLRFRRWLGLRNIDAAVIEASTNGAHWTRVWSSAGAGFADNGWQPVQLALPAEMAGATALQLRWGLSSGGSGGRPARIGWNLDDVELLGDGAVDAAPPVPALNVAGLTAGGSPSHACSVTYTDSTGVRLASLDAADLVVHGPNGYTNTVEFTGADLPADGSPLTGGYSLPAPGGVWDDADNGTYVITLLAGAVEDTLHNATPETVLGAFEAGITTASPGVLAIAPGDELQATGPAGGPFIPGSIAYTLTNAGGSPLVWQAGAGAPWVGLSAGEGNLPAGASVEVIVTLGPAANGLPPGDYTDLLAFRNLTNGRGDAERAIRLQIVNPRLVQLAVTANPPHWGQVSPAGGAFPAGTSVALTATPEPYFRFVEWRGDASGTGNPQSLLLDTDAAIEAVFGEQFTPNHPKPLWWLAAHGHTQDWETAVVATGANGLPLWQSYVAGLDPDDPSSRLRIELQPATAGAGHRLRWQTVAGRTYTVSAAASPEQEFVPLAGAMDLPPAVQEFVCDPRELPAPRYYRLEVRKP